MELTNCFHREHPEFANISVVGAQATPTPLQNRDAPVSIA